MTSGLGEVVVIYLRHPQADLEAGLPLLDSRFETIDGERFIVGVVSEKAGDWSSGLRAGVRWSEVTNFLSFESRSDFDQRTSEARKRELGERGN